MVINDRIYDEIEVKEPVIEALITSKPMQRLAHISQDGAPHYIQPLRNVNRLEHSIGVWYLSSLYDRPIEEQIASLLHDIPHTAFSHVVDFVVQDERHEFHEEFTQEVILNSEIPDILKQHNINIDRVLHKENYDLLENDLPDISVDRWDYFMRDGFTFGLLPKEIVKLFLGSVKEKDQQFYFEDIHMAGMFAVLYMNFSRLIWMDPTSHGTFFLLSEALKLGLAKNVVTMEDFFTTDEEVMGKLQKANDAKINELLHRLHSTREFYYADEHSAEFYGPNKPRFVDPFVLRDGILRRVSVIIPGMADYFEQFKKQYEIIGVSQREGSPEN